MSVGKSAVGPAGEKMAEKGLAEATKLLEKLDPQRSHFASGGWTFTATKHHILSTVCRCGGQGGAEPKGGSGEGAPEPGATSLAAECRWCEYSRALRLPALPEMVFADNGFRLGLGGREAEVWAEWEPLAALKAVDADKADEALKVGAADAWQGARTDALASADVFRPFDWTFTTLHQGTFHGFVQTPTDEEIPLDRLRVEEPILWFAEVPLYEDELADHGASVFSVKFRAMASGWFLLARLYLRVDGVLVRVVDTRLFWDALRPLRLLREWGVREARVADLPAAARGLVREPARLWPLLPQVAAQRHVLTWPAQPTPS